MILLLHLPHYYLFLAEIVLFPQNATIMLGENGTFLCASATGTTAWTMTKDNITLQLDTDHLLQNQEEIGALAEQNIFIAEWWIGGEYVSTLTITGSHQKNFTMVKCALADQCCNFNFSTNQVAFLRIFGNF